MASIYIGFLPNFDILLVWLRLVLANKPDDVVKKAMDFIKSTKRWRLIMHAYSIFLPMCSVDIFFQIFFCQILMFSLQLFSGFMILATIGRLLLITSSYSCKLWQFHLWQSKWQVCILDFWFILVLTHDMAKKSWLDSVSALNALNDWNSVSTTRKSLLDTR
jgi:hypothetical protein